MNKFTRRDFINKSAMSIGSIAIGSAAFSGFLQSSCVNRNINSVPTLRGSIDCSKMGTTLMHEHIIIGQVPETLEKATVDIAVKMLNEAADAGVTTLVDVMPFDSYCNSASGIASISREHEKKNELYEAIASQTPVNIIVSTGFYRYEKAPEEIRSMTESQMETRIYKATHACTGAREQFDLLVSHGADPNHLDFAHIETESGWTKGINREQFAADFLSLVKEGGYLLFNNFSCEFYTPWADMVYLLRYYCDQGYANRILISEDCNWEWKNNRQVFEGSEEHPEAADRTYAYFMSHEVPMMVKSGFTEEEIETFLVHNPCNFFSVHS